LSVLYDLVIAGGRVIDPPQGLDAVQDVAIHGDRIAAVAPAIDRALARQVVDARGRVVCAGLIDLHTHIGWGHAHSLDPDLLAYLGGATTNCDAGTVGRLWFRGWRRFVHEACHSRALVFLCANDIGQLWHDHWRLDALNPAVTGAFIREHRDVIVGVKLRLLNIEHARPSTLVTAARVKEMAAIAGVPTMFHMPEGTTIQPSIIAQMEPGDILTHCFASVFHLFAGDRVLGLETRIAAQERGILLDVGHGQAGFDFQIAAAYLAAGVAPDTISTDLHGNCIWRRAFDMPTVMSKFLYLGMSLPEVIRRATINPARAIRRDHDLGSLHVGKFADIAVLELMDGRFELTDGHDRNRVTARQMLRAVTTICRGRPLPYQGEYPRSRATWLPKAPREVA
jgi:dihydroorotase